MSKRVWYMILLSAVALCISSLGLAQDTAENLNDSCVMEGDFAPDVDYFPEKVEVTEAKNFTVDYFNNYKVVTATGSMETYNYVLVQCGTPAPDSADFPEGTQFIEVPTGNVIALSTTQLPHLAALDRVDHLVGLDSFLYTNTPEVREMIETGDLVEVAPNFALNLEMVLDAEPDMVLSDDYDAERFALLRENDIFTAINTEYLEGTPLGRAEWLKYTSLFYNQEGAANAVYGDIVEAYTEAQAIAADVPLEDRPVVLWNFAFEGVWGLPGTETFAGIFIQDAGGAVAMADEIPANEISYVSTEVVYESALDADIWFVNAYAVPTLEDFIALDPRYEDFAAVENGNVWNNDRDVNENFGNNYYELAVLRPDLVLLDLIAILYPDRLPDHELRFMRSLSEGA